MKKGVININNKTFDVDIALSEDEQYKGLSDTESLDENKGMLFLFKKPISVFFVMRGMKYPLDLIFIDSDGFIVNMSSAEKDSKKEYNSKGKVKAVLELNKNNIKNFKVGDEVKLTCKNKIDKEKFINKVSVIVKSFKGGGELTYDVNKALKIGDVFYDDIKPTEGVELEDDGFYVLNDNKEAIYKIKGGERVFSIDHTDKLFNKVLSVQKNESDVSQLGKLVVDIINTQDNNKGQFVKAAEDGMLFPEGEEGENKDGNEPKKYSLSDIKGSDDLNDLSFNIGNDANGYVKLDKNINLGKIKFDTEKVYSTYKDSISKLSNEYGIDPKLMSAILIAESNGNKDAVSGTGAIGLMQLHGTTKDFYKSKGYDLSDPEQNIHAGIDVFKKKYNVLKRWYPEKDERELAWLTVRAYNGGQGYFSKKDMKMSERAKKENEDYVKRVYSIYNDILNIKK